MKGNNDNELKLIKNFITKINNANIAINSAINNKNKAGNEFRKLKKKVTDNILRRDLRIEICLEKILKVLNQKKNMKKV